MKSKLPRHLPCSLLLFQNLWNSTPWARKVLELLARKLQHHLPFTHSSCTVLERAAQSSKIHFTVVVRSSCHDGRQMLSCLVLVHNT